MEIIQTTKEVLLVITPIIVAVISYCSNKKSRKEIMYELQAKLQEKDRETANEIKKISADIEKQKQLSSWGNSMEVTSKYIESIGIKRYATIMSIKDLTAYINNLMYGELRKDDLNDLFHMLKRINLPSIEDELYPIELPILFEYALVKKRIQIQIEQSGRCKKETSEG